MDNRTVARADLGRLNPGVFLEVGGHHEILVGYYSFGRDGKRLGEREYQVGLTKAPPLGESRFLRFVPGLALTGSAVHPGHDCIDILL
jgi:hypothetical protein